ncbi:MAG: hypothetical protein H7287_11580 [Thermoleophilia bacterium]|nr:hypothetical protein [Thermoleophilia bacterium]
MAFWNRTPRPATRAWISITTRASGPSVVLREAARHARVTVLETVNFDDRTAAVSPRLRGINRVTVAGAPLPLNARDRHRLEALLRDVRMQEGVTDVVFETHVAGREDATAERHFPLHELLTLIEAGGLMAGTRYVTD